MRGESEATQPAECFLLRTPFEQHLTLKHPAVVRGVDPLFFFLVLLDACDALRHSGRKAAFESIILDQRALIILNCVGRVWLLLPTAAAIKQTRDAIHRPFHLYTG